MWWCSPGRLAAGLWPSRHAAQSRHILAELPEPGFLDDWPRALPAACQPVLQRRTGHPGLRRSLPVSRYYYFSNLPGEPGDDEPPNTRWEEICAFSGVKAGNEIPNLMEDVARASTMQNSSAPGRPGLLALPRLPAG